MGTPVRAVSGGEVIQIGYDNILGKFISVRHIDGRVSVYGHLSHTIAVLHEKVKSGTILGNVGSTGRATGPHLHFEIRENGVPKNPINLLEKRQ